jgi:murein L,D-transpeptidase YcbB/YkuD
MQVIRASARPGGSLLAGYGGGMCRRGVGMLGVIAGFVLLTVPAHAQAAQANWWEGITGYGTPDYTGRRSEERAQERERERAARLREPPDDLRSDPTPWRSDEMIASIQAAIERYQSIVASGGWPYVPPGRMMREGEDDERVHILRRRLQLSGDLVPRGTPYNNDTFDDTLAQAVRHFQRRNGLRTTGRVERSTYPALNISAEQRLAQLRLNLGRVRELLAKPTEDRYVLVNIPAFQLEAVEKYEVQQRHRVIVGRTERQSPSVTATIRALNFFPYWREPDSVAHLDLIPRLLKEPDYLAKEKIRVLNGVDGFEVDPMSVNWGSPEALKLKFRQDPGPQNALGLVRIDMPNQHTVYMHDTPMKQLFAQRSRAFSAGCVRVENVFALVDWIAGYEPGWQQPGRAREIVETGQALDVNLTRPIPVHFVYITAWAERDGEVEFRPDIYGRDGAVDMIAEMDRDPNEPPPQATLAP